MIKRIRAIASVIGVILALTFVWTWVRPGFTFGGNIPYVPPYPGSTVVESSANPGVTYGGTAARMVVSIPDGSGYALWFQTAAYDEYITLLGHHGWHRPKSGEFYVIQTNCYYKKFIHSDSVVGPGWTLSVSEESMKDGSDRIETLVTRGNRTGPQSCRDM